MNNKLQNAYNWLVIVFLVLMHFIYLAGANGKFDFGVLLDPFSIIHLVFSTLSSVMSAGMGIEKGVEVGIQSEEFKKAQEIDNKDSLIISENRKPFNKFIQVTNREEKEIAQENFLLDNGVFSVDELNKKQLKQYKKVEYIKHDAKDITLPLYFEKSKGNKVEYKTNFDSKEYKRKKMLSKAFLGVITGFMSVNLIFTAKTFGEALGTIIIVIGGIIAAYMTNNVPVVYKLKHDIPNKVINKHNLVEAFKKRLPEMQELVKQDVIIRTETKEENETIILQLPPIEV